MRQLIRVRTLTYWDYILKIQANFILLFNIYTYTRWIIYFTFQAEDHAIFYFSIPALLLVHHILLNLATEHQTAKIKKHGVLYYAILFTFLLLSFSLCWNDFLLQYFCSQSTLISLKFEIKQYSHRTTCDFMCLYTSNFKF